MRVSGGPRARNTLFLRFSTGFRAAREDREVRSETDVLVVGAGPVGLRSPQTWRGGASTIC
jgi:threonine dehydrogenase-like Zn-dependent dehydrogenase